MRKDGPPLEASKQYEAAHMVHFRENKLHRALELYLEVIAAHPLMKEAEYSRTQIHNIANSVVPKQELLDAHVKLARAHLECEGPADAEPASVTPSSSMVSS